MFIKLEHNWRYNKPVYEWLWLQLTVMGMVIQSLNEGKTDITNYPVNGINMPICYYKRLNDIGK